MTATRDRRRDLDAEFDGVAWDQRPAFGASRGWPWWGAVLLALGLSLVGAVVDMQLEKQLSIVFEGAYVIGCVGAVVLVRRKNLFGPMVQPPLVLVVVVPVTVAVTTGLPSGGVSAKALAVGDPLLKGFPVMAIATAISVLIGLFRYLKQRRPAGATEDEFDAPARDRRRPSGRDGGPDRDDREPARSRRPAPGEQRRSGQGGRPSAGRGAPERAGSRDRGDARGRSSSADRGGSGSGRSGDRGGAARGGRPSREDGRRQPPRRRDDDY